MRKSVTHNVWGCTIRKQQKHAYTHPVGLLQHLGSLDMVWDELTMDFIEALSNS